MKSSSLCIVLLSALLASVPARAQGYVPASREMPIPTLDLSGDASRQVVVARGTEEIYQGHPTTVLLPDGKTMYCVWTIGHGGPCGPLKRSDDGGKTWSDLLPVPENWSKASNCPTIYRLVDPKGVARLFVFAGHGPDEGKTMHYSYSEDEGKTWSPMRPSGLGGTAMPFCDIKPIDGGKRLLGVTNIRRPGETKDKTSNVIAQSISEDGGFTWSAPWRVVLDIPDRKPCEPELVRSPDGKQLLCLIRENVKHESLYMTSDDEGRTWSKPKFLPRGLWGDRHKAKYTPDGRLVVCFRDTGRPSPTRNHFVAWVGRYDDIVNGKKGLYRIKLINNHRWNMPNGRFRDWDCGYSGVEVLPDGTVVATTYTKYTDGPELNSVVSVRFNLQETDQMLLKLAKKKQK
ncbi:glycoside hydrolase [Termitidicoccus mucosus]|uniref:sialidase family protein n=1 Tax=Termitidicoccus mucosus TaxID=1184151 RepID=UPI000A5C311D